jgi:hypothetical protein
MGYYPIVELKIVLRQPVKVRLFLIIFLANTPLKPEYEGKGKQNSEKS